MRLDNIKFLKYGSNISLNGKNYQFVGECRSQMNYLVIDKDTNEQATISRADFNNVELVDEVKYITSDYKTKKMLKQFTPYYLFDNSKNEILDVIEVVMYGSDEYHFIITKSSNKYVYTRTYHICEFAEELERKNWTLLSADEVLLNQK